MAWIYCATHAKASARELRLSDINFCAALRLRLGLAVLPTADDHCRYCDCPIDYAADTFHVLGCNDNWARVTAISRHDSIKYRAVNQDSLCGMNTTVEQHHHPRHGTL